MSKVPNFDHPAIKVSNVGGQLVERAATDAERKPKPSIFEAVAAIKPYKRPADLTKMGVLARIPHIELEDGVVQGVGGLCQPTLYKFDSSGSYVYK
ncbi:MAG: hypothetical protein ABIT47_01130 [Candidatus Paceibacterota bacterium]